VTRKITRILLDTVNHSGNFAYYDSIKRKEEITLQKFHKFNGKKCKKYQPPCNQKRKFKEKHKSISKHLLTVRPVIKTSSPTSATEIIDLTTANSSLPPESIQHSRTTITYHPVGSGNLQHSENHPTIPFCTPESTQQCNTNQVHPFNRMITQQHKILIQRYTQGKTNQKSCSHRKVNLGKDTYTL
jgi:hypothetical protein